MPPGDTLLLPSFLGSFLNCLAVKPNSQARYGEGSLFIAFLGKLRCIECQGTYAYM